jgi:outer membrane lipase/esterase
LGLPSLSASLDGGNGYAYAGSKSGVGTNVRFPSPTFPPNPAIDVVRAGSQIDAYLGARSAFNDTQLITLWTGANDIRDATGPADIVTIVSNVEAHIRQLEANGAKHIIVPNQPNAALAPFFQLPGAPSPNAIVAAIGAFNTLLAQRLTLLEQDASLDLDLIRLDTFAPSNEVAANPAAFGFTNASAPGLAFDRQSGQFIIAPDAATHLFYDVIHPTSRFHQIIADRAVAALAVPAPSSLLLLLAGFIVLASHRRGRSLPATPR